MAAQESASWPKTWNLLHPNAAALIGVDVRGIRDSAIGQSFAQQFKATGGALPLLPGAAMLPVKDFLNDIDRVIISSPGAPAPGKGAAKGNTPAKKQNPPFLAIVTGHFSAEHLKPFLKGKPETHSTVDIYRPNPQSTTGIAMLDERTLLMGDMTSILGAIDRSEAVKPVRPPLLARASSLASTHEFWMLLTVPPSALQPSNASLGAVGADITGMEFGMAFRDSFRLDLNLATKSAESAQRMARMLKAQLQMGLAGKLNEQQAAELMRKLEITTDGNSLGLHVEASREELERNLRAMQQARSAGSQPGSPTAARPAPEPGTIRIYGLEEGVVTVPTEPPKQD